jgi:hypothetical protein
MDLRVEHFHCFSEHGQGGHYHFDTTPNEVEYRGYFMLADYVYRVDQPPQTNNHHTIVPKLLSEEVGLPCTHNLPT